MRSLATVPFLVRGNTAVVGAYGEDAGGSNAGAAYFFGRDEGGAGNWGEVPYAHPRPNRLERLIV